MDDSGLGIATEIEKRLAAGRRDGEPHLADVARLIGERFGGGCVIYLRSEARDALVPVAAHQRDPELAARLQEFMGAPSSWSSRRVLAVLEALGTLVISGTPSQIDAFLDTPNHPHAVRADLRSMIAVPVHEPSAGLVGALLVGRHGAGRYDRGDRDALLALAGSLAATLDRERLAWELHERLADDSRTERELVLARRRFAAAFRDSPVALALFTLGPGPSVLLEINRRLTALLGTTQEALLAHPSPSDFLHPEDIDARRLAAHALLVEGADVVRLEQRVLPATGPPRLCEMSLSLVRDDTGEPQYGVCHLIDVTDARRDEEQRVRHVRRQAALVGIGRRALAGEDWRALVDETVPILEAAVEGCTVCLLERTDAGPAVLAGPAALGLTRALPLEPVLLESRRLPREWLAQGARGAVVTPVGTRAWLALLSRTDARMDRELLEFAEAAAHLLAVAQERGTPATVDALTGLANRALFGDRVAHALARAARAGTALAVVRIDVDRFRDINEAFGYATGDELLRALAHALGTALRASDTLARIDGDEFGVLCEDVGDERGAIAAVRRLMAALDAPLGERRLRVSAAFGVAVASAGAATADGLRRDAGTALLRAKERPGSVYELFDAALRRRVAERVSLEQDLRRALEREQFVLHYQPLVSLGRQRIVGVEALVRWQHPERGLLAPAAFVPVAEESGLIVEIGRWVLTEACRQLARWLADPAIPPIYVSVNLSGRQLARPELAQEVEDTLRRAGVPPHRLALELTETVLLEDAHAPVAVLQRLHDVGVQVFLDDFGTGYSSLSSIRRLPLHGLKIDRSFVAGVPDDESDCTLLRAIIAMAAALDLAVVAEGVETNAQAAWLAGVNCGFAQGFGLARPAPAERIEPLLRSGLQWAAEPPAPGREAESTITLREAAEALRVSASTLRRWADTGRLAAVRTPGGHRRFPVSEVRRIKLESASGARGELQPIELPLRPIPAVAAIVGARPDLVPAAAASIYRPGRPGWFGSQANVDAIIAWVESLAVACRDGEYGAAVAATQRLLVEAEYAGTTLLERCLCLERCRDVMLREMRDRRVPQPELMAAQRLGFRLAWLAVELRERADGPRSGADVRGR